MYYAGILIVCVDEILLFNFILLFCKLLVYVTVMFQNRSYLNLIVPFYFFVHHKTTIYEYVSLLIVFIHTSASTPYKCFR